MAYNKYVKYKILKMKINQQLANDEMILERLPYGDDVVKPPKSKQPSIRMLIANLTNIVIKQSDRLDSIEKTQHEQGEILKEHSKILNEHSEILKEHSKILEKHSKILEKHSKILEKHAEILKRNDLR